MLSARAESTGRVVTWTGNPAGKLGILYHTAMEPNCNRKVPDMSTGGGMT
jgi:hypothetical protein